MLLQRLAESLGFGGRDKRRHRRIDTRVTVRFAKSDEPLTVTNLSLGGFAINWPEPVPSMTPGTVLPVLMHLGPDHAIKARARVVRHESEMSLAFCFIGLTARDREALDWYILLHDRPGRGVPHRKN